MAATLADLRVLYRSEGFVKINDEFAKARGNAKKNFGEIARVAGAGMTVAGAAIVGTLGLATKAALSFESGMRDVGTLGVKDLGKLRDGVLDYTVAMGQDAKQATVDLYQALSKGVSEGSALDVLTSSAKAAAAGVGEVSDALDLGTSVANAYGIKLDGTAAAMAQYENILGSAVTAVKLGSTTIGEMGAAMGRVAPIAQSAGLSFKELFASIAGITSVGIKPREAISGLKAALSNVIKPSKEATEVSAALGLQFDVSAIKTKGWAGLLQDVNEKVTQNGPALAAMRDQLGEQIASLDENTEAGKRNVAQIKEMKSRYKELQGVSNESVSTMAVLFGSIEGLNAVLALTSGTGAEKFDEALKQMDDGAATLNLTFEEWKKDNPAFMFAQAKAALEKLAIEIGRLLLPALRNLALLVTPVVSKLADLVRGSGFVGKSFAVIIGGIGGLMLAFGPMIMMLPTLTGLWKAFHAVKASKVLFSAAKAARAAGGAYNGLLGTIGTGVVWGVLTFYVLKYVAAIMMAHDAEKALEKVHEQNKSDLTNITALLDKSGIAYDKQKTASMTTGQQISYLTGIYNEHSKGLKKSTEEGIVESANMYAWSGNQISSTLGDILNRVDSTYFAVDQSNDKVVQGFERLPEAVGRGAGKAADNFHDAAVRMQQDTQMTLDMMAQLDMNQRHSPSLNDRFRKALRDTQGIFARGMGGIAGATGFGRNAVYEASSAMAATGTGMAVAQADRAQQAPRPVPAAPRGGGSVIVNLYGTTIRETADVDVVVQEIGRQVQGELLLRGAY